MFSSSAAADWITLSWFGPFFTLLSTCDDISTLLTLRYSTETEAGALISCALKLVISELSVLGVFVSTSLVYFCISLFSFFFSRKSASSVYSTVVVAIFFYSASRLVCSFCLSSSIMRPLTMYILQRYARNKMANPIKK